MISHDRWFLDRIATHVLAFEGDSQVRWFEGNFSEYEEWRHKELGAAPTSRTASSTRSSPSRRNRAHGWSMPGQSINVVGVGSVGELLVCGPAPYTARSSPSRV